MYITLELWYVPLEFRVHRPLSVLILALREVMKMDPNEDWGYLSILQW